MKVMPVVLLTGGLGLRQRSDGDDLPKSLRPLPDGRPLLLHVLDYYRAFGLREFVLCVGYGADRIQAMLIDAFGVPADRITAGVGWTRLDQPDQRLTLVDSGVSADKCQRLLDARTHIGGRRFLLGYGDVLSDLDLNDLVRVHDNGGGMLSMTVTQVRSRYGCVELAEGSVVVAFHEKPMDPSPVSAGYFVCEPDLFEELAADLEFECDVLPRLAAARQMHAHRHDGLWVSLDTYKDFVDIAAIIDRKGFAWCTPV